jgi:hypothetical protein
MRDSVTVALAAVLAIGWAAAFAQGSVIQYGTDGLVDSYSVPVGRALAVRVYLYEIFDPAAETSILDDEEGLFSTGLAIRRTSAGPTQPAGVLSVAGIAHNLSFNENEPTVSPLEAVGLTGGMFDRAMLVESRGLLETTGVVAEAPASNVRRVLLGTFTFTAGSVLGETTALRIEDNDVTLDDTVTWALPGVSLDADIQPFDFSVDAVPEPATVGLLAVGMLTLLRWRGWPHPAGLSAHGPRGHG